MERVQVTLETQASREINGSATRPMSSRSRDPGETNYWRGSLVGETLYQHGSREFDLHRVANRLEER